MRYFRLIQVVFSIFLLVLAAGFIFQWSWAINLWPWSDYYTKPHVLSFLFMGSICAAIGVPSLWVAIVNDVGAARAGALDLLISFTAISIFMFQGYASSNNQRLLIGGIVLGFGALSTLVVLFLSARIPIADPRPMPTPVRIAFAIFAVTLIIVGSSLVLKTPNILPWQLSVEGSVVYGWIFLGAATYFTLAVFDPSWHNAAGQLLGFLAYDIVLIVPFIQHFSDVIPELRLNLIVYTLVVVSSALLAIYYLFIHPSTRFAAAARH